MSTGANAKLIDSLHRLGAFEGTREIVLSDNSTDPEWPERTIAVVDELGVSIANQYKDKTDREDWKTWQDSGASLSWDEVKALLAGLAEIGIRISIDES